MEVEGVGGHSGVPTYIMSALASHGDRFLASLDGNGHETVPRGRRATAPSTGRCANSLAKGLSNGRVKAIANGLLMYYLGALVV